jgi:hypothetical protein
VLEKEIWKVKVYSSVIHFKIQSSMIFANILIILLARKRRYEISAKIHLY